MFEKDCTLRQGRQKCHVYRHKAADGLSNTITPAVVPAPRQVDLKNGAKDEGEEEVERLEKLLKKHEMGEIQRVDWLDQLTFRAIEQRGLLARPSRKATKQTRAHQSPSAGRSHDPDHGQRNGADDEMEHPNGDLQNDDDSYYTLFIDFPRFDFPIVFTDHEYPSPSIFLAARHTPSSSTVTLRPPPGVQLNLTGTKNSEDDPMGGRIVKIYDPEVFSRDNPAEGMHRRLVRSHRTSLLNRDIKPNPKIRDELNVSTPEWSSFAYPVPSLLLVRASPGTR